MNELGNMSNWVSNVFKTTANSTGGSKNTVDNTNRQSGTSVERPDISNIDCVGAAVAVPRLKHALRSFPHNEFDLEKVAKSLKLSASIGEGACFGLSMLWLESMMIRPNSSPINKHGTLTTNTGLQGAFTRQQRYEEKHAEALGALARLSPEAAAQQAAVALFAELGLSVTAKVSGGLDEEHLALLIAKPGHYIIALTGFNDAHSLAVTTQNSHEQTPRITVFDPVAGEFKMHEHEAEYFLTALNARYKTVGWKYSGMDVFSLKKNTSGADAGSARVQTLRQALAARI